MTSQSKTELIISAVDKATATLNLIGARMDALVKPAVDVQKAFGRIYEVSRLGGPLIAIAR
jgi:hypothetical protein